jgi:hypothetical protein
MKEDKLKYLKYRVADKLNYIYFATLENDILIDFFIFDERNNVLKSLKAYDYSTKYSEHIGKEAKVWRFLEESIEWISDCSTLELIKEQFPEYFI